MPTRSEISWATMLALALLLVAASSAANAITMRECSVKYKAAQSAGTLQGKTWSDFRKAECGPTASATPAETPTTNAKAAVPKGGNTATTTGKIGRAHV